MKCNKCLNREICSIFEFYKKHNHIIDAKIVNCTRFSNQENTVTETIWQSNIPTVQNNQQDRMKMLQEKMAKSEKNKEISNKAKQIELQEEQFEEEKQMTVVDLNGTANSICEGCGQKVNESEKNWCSICLNEICSKCVVIENGISKCPSCATQKAETSNNDIRKKSSKIRKDKK